MKIATLIARLLLGLVFVASGVAFFLTTPPALEGPIGEFFKGMAATRYFFFLLKGTEIFTGLALLTGLFVPLALVVLAPIILNIFLIHLFIAPAPTSIAIAVVLGLLEIFLAFISPQYSPTIKQLFRTR